MKLDQVILHIAGFKIAIRSEANGVITNLREMFKNHLFDGDSYDAKLEVKIADMRPYLNIEALPFSNTSKESIFTNYVYASAYNPEDRSATLLTSPSNAYPFTEEYLMVLTSFVCLSFGKILFHCAALCNDDNELFLFYGPSGIGKSTTARNFSKDLHLISDDLVILEPDDSGKLRVFKTPFTRDKSRDERDGELYELKGLYRIHQGTEVHKEEMKSTEAILSFLGNIWALDKHPMLLQKYLKIGKRIIENTTTCNLHLKKESRFEEILH